MKDNTKLLEDRVQSAIKRLKTLSEERRRLESEVRTLQTRLERAERERLAREDAPSAPEEAPGGWLEQRSQIVETLKETIADLRSD